MKICGGAAISYAEGQPSDHVSVAVSAAPGNGRNPNVSRRLGVSRAGLLRQIDRLWLIPKNTVKHCYSSLKPTSRLSAEMSPNAPK